MGKIALSRLVARRKSVVKVVVDTLDVESRVPTKGPLSFCSGSVQDPHRRVPLTSLNALGEGLNDQNSIFPA